MDHKKCISFLIFDPLVPPNTPIPTDLTVAETDWSSGVASITAQSTISSEQYGDPTDVSSGLSDISRLVETQTEIESEWDASTTVPYPKKY